MEVASDPWQSWYLSTKSCINVHCPSAEVLFVQASRAIALSTGSDRLVKGNSYCCSMYSPMVNLGNKKCTILINDYIPNETL